MVIRDCIIIPLAQPMQVSFEEMARGDFAGNRVFGADELPPELKAQLFAAVGLPENHSRSPEHRWNVECDSALTGVSGQLAVGSG